MYLPSGEAEGHVYEVSTTLHGTGGHCLGYTDVCQLLFVHDLLRRSHATQEQYFSV